MSSSAGEPFHNTSVIWFLIVRLLTLTLHLYQCIFAHSSAGSRWNSLALSYVLVIRSQHEIVLLILIRGSA